MGKSTVARMFRREGVPVFDADAVVRRLQGPGGVALALIEAAFPGTVHAGVIDRVALGTRVFGDKASLKHLEAMLHPLVASERSRFLARYRARRMVVFDVPLLLETGGEALVDAVAVVSAPPRVQRARVLARPGMDSSRLAAVLTRQMPDSRKRLLADYIVETGRGKRSTRDQVRRIRSGVVRRRTRASVSSRRRLSRHRQRGALRFV